MHRTKKHFDDARAALSDLVRCLSCQFPYSLTLDKGACPNCGQTSHESIYADSDATGVRLAPR